MKRFSIILAVDEKNGIGKNGTIPWKLKKEQQYFKNITTATKNKDKKNIVIMGRKTWESIPSKVRPLPGRINCILSSSYTEKPTNIQEGVYGFRTFEACLDFANKSKDVEKIFIIGGSYLYNLVLDSDKLENIYLTRVHGNFDCDVIFSDIPHYFKITNTSEVFEENDIKYQMFEYKNKKILIPKIKNFFTAGFGKLKQPLLKDRQKLKLPALIIGGILFLILILVLLLKTFSPKENSQSETTKPITNEGGLIVEDNITDISSSDETQQDPISLESSNNDIEEGNQNDILSEESPDFDIDTILTEEDNTIETDQGAIEDSSLESESEILFGKREIKDENLVIYYPVTEDRSLDIKIKDFIDKKKIEYRILLFNQKNAGLNEDIILDYEIKNGDTKGGISIIFTDTLGGEIISTTEIF